MTMYPEAARLDEKHQNDVAEVRERMGRIDHDQTGDAHGGRRCEEGVERQHPEPGRPREWGPEQHRAGEDEAEKAGRQRLRGRQPSPRYGTRGSVCHSACRTPHAFAMLNRLTRRPFWPVRDVASNLPGLGVLMAPKDEDAVGTPDENGVNVSRRAFLKTVGDSSVAATVVGGAAEAQTTGAPAARPRPGANRADHQWQEAPALVEPRVTLLDAMRDRLDHTGLKRVCDRGSCGACTAIIDGRTAYTCSMLAIEAQGKEIRTVEGLTPKAPCCTRCSRRSSRTTARCAVSARRGS